ncbi:SusE domain-containing protein [Chitinophagaceae bacterium LWZ2-11]
MKKVINKLVLIAGLALLFAACKKDESRAVVKSNVTAPTLAATPTTLVLDSNKNATTAIVFSWGSTDFGFSAAITYTLQFDTTAAGTFSKSINVTLGQNLLTQAYTVKDFNQLLMTTVGMPTGVATNVSVRLKLDVAQNNGSQSLVPSVYSNAVILTVTPYSSKPTPKYPVPSNLYIIGDATPGDWANPTTVPDQQMTQMDDYGNVFGIVLQLTGGKSYVFLPKNTGDWSTKYNVASAAAANPAGDAFMPNAGNDNIPGPAASGLYQIVVDFVKGTYTVTPVTTNPVPATLFLIGDATANGWANPILDATMQFTRVSAAEFQITTSLIGGKSYVFLPVNNGSWDHKYGGSSAIGGTLLSDGNVPGSNTPAPTVTGNYLIDVNFLKMQYTVTPK